MSAMSNHPHADAVRRHVADGLSNRAIAEALGMTRNAVLGLRHRLKLPTGKVPKPVPVVLPRPAPILRPRPRQTHAFAVVPLAKIAPAPIPVAPELAHAGVSFDALKAGGCKWPDGDGDALTFCGAPALVSAKGVFKPYCACHTARAFVKPARSEKAVDKGWRR